MIWSMKKILFMIVLLIVVSTTVLLGQITIKQADNAVFEYLEKEKIVPDYWLYANDSILSNNIKVETLVDEILSPDYPCWVYFVDEQPFANWSHKCRYLFVNKGTGDILTKKESFPPRDIANWRMITNQPELPIGKKFSFPGSSLVLKSGLVPQNCYAVIISGGANAYNNWVR